MNKKTSLWERYLTKEIGIEFKSCLYFFAILFFYCMYRVINHVYSADILHMTEMILLCYAIGYIQMLLFNNFDEAEKLRGREIAGIIFCTALYTGLSYLFGWLDKNIMVTAFFALYIVVLYICVFLIYYTKRKIDDKELNKELELFKARPDKEENEE